MCHAASRVVLATLLAVIALPLLAASYIVPPDAEMIRAADAIAIVNIESSRSYVAPDGAIATDHIAVIERGLKSRLRAGARVVITQRGGTIGDISLGISSEPRFLIGERTLLILRRVAPGRYSILSGELGKFSFVTDAASRTLLVRGASDDEIMGWDLAGRRYVDPARDAESFLRYIESVVAGRENGGEYFAEAAAAPGRLEPQNHVGPFEYSVAARARWQDGSFMMRNTNDQPGESNTVGILQAAMDGWSNAPNSNISISYGGVNPAGSYDGDAQQPDSENHILFNQPNSGPLDGATVGVAGYWFTNSTHPFNGGQFRAMGDCDIVVESGFAGSVLQSIVGHELGHCLGIRHSNDPQAGQTTSTTDALMNSQVSGDASLKAWDNDAASHLYGSGASVCNAVAISAQSGAVTINEGSSTNLSVTATGTAPLTYQWYTGNTGNTSSPIAGATNASINVSPTTTTTYWVRVSGCEGSTANSNAATVTVNPAVCNPPNIIGQPQNVTITAGQSTQLTVSANGTGPFTYQWFTGASGNISSPIGGATNSTVNVSPTTTTTYWVRVTGCNNTTANSNAATVTVNPVVCNPPNIIGQPQDASIAAGQATQLTVSANGSAPLTYQWFNGASGNTSSPIPGANQATVQVAPTSNATYWVRVTGNCGEPVNSRTVTVTVTECPDVVVGTPQASQLGNGSYQLSVSANSSGRQLTFAWFRGTTPGSGGTLVGTSATVNVPAPTAATSYWVRVQNDCGKSADSPLVTISNCVLPVIVTQPNDRTINSGQSTQLNVVLASSAGTTVRWYRGTAPDKTTQVGTGESVTVGPLTTTTSFWASITNSCGEIQTRTVVVTVAAVCNKPNITAITPSSATRVKGETVTLVAAAAGDPTLSYQWYEGAAGDISHPVGTNSATFTSAPLNDTTRFWVKVTNSCGDASSSTVNVEVKKPRRRAAGHRN